MIGQAIGDDQLALMNQSAAGINDIGHVAFALVLIRLQQRLAKAADHLAGIVAIQQKRADAVLAHGADAMAEHQPAGIGFNRRSAIAELNQLPRESGLEQ